MPQASGLRLLGHVDRVVGRLFGARAFQHGFRQDAGIFADAALDLGRDLRVVLEEVLGIFPALADPLILVGEPGARFLDDAGVDAEVEQLAGLRPP